MTLRKEEFKSDDGYSTVPDSIGSGKSANKRKADKDQGDMKTNLKPNEMAAKLRTKAGMMNEIMKAMGNLNKEGVQDLYKNLLAEEDDEDSDDKKKKIPPQFKKKAKAKADDEDSDDDSGDDNDDDDIDITVNVDADDNDDDEDSDDKKKPVKEKMKKEDLQIDFDVASLFESGNFSDEFKVRTQEMFETAILTNVNNNLESIIESSEQDNTDSIYGLQENLVDKIDGYLDYFTEQFMEENKLAIDNGIRNEISEDFIVGMRKLFSEHYIDVPENKVDLVDSLADRVEDLEEDLNNEIRKNIELKEQVENEERIRIVNEESYDLSESQKEKLFNLVDNIEYESESELKEKVGDLKENFIKRTGKPNSGNREALYEDLDGVPLSDDEDNSNIDPFVKQTVSYLNKMAK